MTRAFLCFLLCLAAVPLRAQFQLVSTGGTSETAVAATFDFGVANQADPLTRQFLLRNTTSSAAKLRVLEVAGTGFSLAAPVNLPQTVEAGAALSFAVTFRSTGEGSYSAVFKSEGVSSLFTSSVVAQVTVAVKTPTGAVTLTAGSTIGFGMVELGSSGATRVLIQNLTVRDQAIPAIAIEGSGFTAVSVPSGILHTYEEAALDLRFTPSTTGLRNGSLTVGTRRFVLSGTGLEAVLPAPQVSVTLARNESGQQGTVAVLLAETARSAATGTVTLEFSPRIAGATDPAIVFANGTRTATFSVAAGATGGSFGGYGTAAFQTGSTAGTLTVTAQLGTATSRQNVEIAAAPPGLSAVTATRATGGIEVQVGGFDNTRGMATLAFTFYDRSGTAIAPGAVTVDIGAEFSRYFQASDAGGLFQAKAVFPVTGDATTIAAVEVVATNAAGSTASARTQF